MNKKHPITPPPELVQQWANQSPIQHSDETWAYELFIAHQAARWGADQELLACGNYLERCAAWEEEDVTEMYNCRRPKPQSLKEQALDAFALATFCTPEDKDVILRALESLPD